MPGFVDEYYASRDIEYCEKIKEMRCQGGTYRSEEQCIAEAEVFIICKQMNTQFLSLSTILNRLDNSNITWKPETLYRFLSMFSNVQPDSNLQYASITQEFFSAGITIVDKDSMRRFASPAIKQTRMQFKKEKNHYIEALGKTRFQELQDGYENISDDQKPFYSIQTAFLIASEERRKRLEAEKLATVVKRNKALTDDERLEYERLKGRKKDKENERLKKTRARQSGKK